MKEKKLWSEFEDSVPDIQTVSNKSLEFTKNLRGFEQYLEDTYRKVFNMSSIELTKQAFNYFEEMQQIFVSQMDNIPKYKGNELIMNSVTGLFAEIQRNESLQFTSFIAQFPICSNCNKELTNQDHLAQFQNQEKRLISLLDQALEGQPMLL